MNMSSIDVLLVEDQPTDAELVLRALASEIPQDRIAWARDGEQALQIMAGMAGLPRVARPRLVLIDLKMPRLDGLDVVRQLRADPTWQHIPLVILSSSADQSDVTRAYEFGVNSYVVKPVNFDALESHVCQLVRYWLGLNVAAA